MIQDNKCNLVTLGLSFGSGDVCLHTSDPRAPAWKRIKKDSFFPVLLKEGCTERRQCYSEDCTIWNHCTRSEPWLWLFIGVPHPLQWTKACFTIRRYIIGKYCVVRVNRLWKCPRVVNSVLNKGSHFIFLFVYLNRKKYSKSQRRRLALTACFTNMLEYVEYWLWLLATVINMHVCICFSSISISSSSSIETLHCVQKWKHGRANQSLLYLWDRQ